MEGNVDGGGYDGGRGGVLETRKTIERVSFTHVS